MDRKELRSRLVLKETSLRQWATQHGYKPDTVVKAVSRYIGKNKLPSGDVTFAILKHLSRTLDAEVVPGILGNEGNVKHTERD
jgi:hypothetical protein